MVIAGSKVLRRHSGTRYFRTAYRFLKWCNRGCVIIRTLYQFCISGEIASINAHIIKATTVNSIICIYTFFFFSSILWNIRVTVGFPKYLGFLFIYLKTLCSCWFTYRCLYKLVSGNSVCCKVWTLLALLSELELRLSKVNDDRLGFAKGGGGSWPDEHFSYPEIEHVLSEVSNERPYHYNRLYRLMKEHLV